MTSWVLKASPEVVTEVVYEVQDAPKLPDRNGHVMYPDKVTVHILEGEVSRIAVYGDRVFAGGKRGPDRLIAAFTPHPTKGWNVPLGVPGWAVEIAADAVSRVGYVELSP